MARNKRFSAIDREMNEALRHARTPGEIASIKRNANLKRQRALTGAPQDLRLDVRCQDVRVIRHIEVPQIEWTIGAERFAEAMNSMGDDLRRRMLYGTWQTEAESPAWKAAKERAKEFLLLHLNDEQKTTMEKFNYFIVTGKSGRLWRIRTTTMAYNVDAVDKHGHVINTFCGVPSGPSVPPCDVYLAQKLQLESDEVEFLLKANRQGQGMGGVFTVAVM
jgi:hypothetical protein